MLNVKVKYHMHYGSTVLMCAQKLMSCYSSFPPSQNLQYPSVIYTKLKCNPLYYNLSNSQVNRLATHPELSLKPLNLHIRIIWFVSSIYNNTRPSVVTLSHPPAPLSKQTYHFTIHHLVWNQLLIHFTRCSLFHLDSSSRLPLVHWYRHYSHHSFTRPVNAPFKKKFLGFKVF